MSRRANYSSTACLRKAQFIAARTILSPRPLALAPVAPAKRQAARHTCRRPPLRPNRYVRQLILALGANGPLPRIADFHGCGKLCVRIAKLGPRYYEVWQVSPSKSLVVAGVSANLPVEFHPSARLLSEIRPEWQAKPLVRRVVALLPVDPGSACQRLVNAAIKDLQTKIIVAGIDLAAEAAKLNKLPPITKADDVLENYSATNTLDLAYRMGLVSRPEWRRLQRAYEIRCDLEHEDAEYEAQPEDCLYVFTTCIGIVLSRDPIELIRVRDVRELIDAPNKTLTPDLLEDYGSAPEIRQIEIIRMLVGVARSPKEPDLVRQHAVEALRTFEPLTNDKVKITIAAEIHDHLKGQPLQPVDMKIAAAIGAVPYLKQRRVAAFYSELAASLLKISPDWGHHDRHTDPLHEIEDYGGLAVIPDEQLEAIVQWMTRCYLGEKGGYGQWGRNRPVFYSDTAAPIIERLFKSADGRVRPILEGYAGDKRIRALAAYQPIARRFEKLVDLVED